MRATVLGLAAMLSLLGCGSGSSAEVASSEDAAKKPSGQAELVALGKALFFDDSLSSPPGQSCASCHGPEAGWTGPHSRVNETTVVYEGANPGMFGDRKPPSAAYATPSPVMHLRRQGVVSGGLFWDGRATGWTLGSPAAEQAKGPFLNPAEQNLRDAGQLVGLVCGGSYGQLFRSVWGAAMCDDPRNVQQAYDKIGFSIAAYEDSPEVNAYSSKADAVIAGKATFTAQEWSGLELFRGKGKCALCHVLEPQEKPLFTDNTYDNLGLPRNPKNPVYKTRGQNWVDPGLGAFLASIGQTKLAEENYGKHRVPPLRNVAKAPYKGFVKAYGHNGYFKSLKEIVHFYNTRDTLAVCEGKRSERIGVDCWPPPEVPQNVNRTELGDLDLTSQEEDAIVAFLETLSDGWKPR